MDLRVSTWSSASFFSNARDSSLLSVIISHRFSNAGVIEVFSVGGKISSFEVLTRSHGGETNAVLIERDSNRVLVWREGNRILVGRESNRALDGEGGDRVLVGNEDNRGLIGRDSNLVLDRREPESNRGLVGRESNRTLIGRERLLPDKVSPD